MVEVEQALIELKRRRDEAERKLRFQRSVSEPNLAVIAALSSMGSRWATKILLMQRLASDERELARTVTMKMMLRHPENQPYRAAYKRDLHRLRMQLRAMAAPYQPVPKKQLAAR